jgi:hypothetical protein
MMDVGHVSDGDGGSCGETGTAGRVRHYKKQTRSYFCAPAATPSGAEDADHRQGGSRY